MIFTTSPNAKFASFTPKDIPYKDSKLSIFFETQEMMEESLILLRFNCPDGSCDYIGSGWEDLKLHVRAIHGHLMWYKRSSSLSSLVVALTMPKQWTLYQDEKNIRPRTSDISSKLTVTPFTVD